MACFAVACFSSDATPPIGSPLLASVRAAYISHPLEVHGLALLGDGAPIVMACVDWVSIRAESYALWRSALASAAGTTPQRVLLSTVHQHGAPMEDLGAVRLAQEAPPLELPMLDVASATLARNAAAGSLREAIKKPLPVTHLGVGEARVERFASNRRLLGPDGKVKAVRFSSTQRTPELRDEPEGLIDPMLKMFSFWNGPRQVAAVSCYATHPMSHYGDGEVSFDLPGLARARLMREDPSIHQIYATGCGADIGAGKYNDGSDAARNALADRLYQAMKQAQAATRTTPLRKAALRAVPLPLTPRCGPGFSEEEMRRVLMDPSAPHYERVRAAFFLNWLRSYAAGHRLELPLLDLGEALIALLPGEPFVAYQLAAQKMRPDAAVMVIGYGDYLPVYIPTDLAFDEGGYEPGPWAFVGPGSEAIMDEALRRVLNASSGHA